jgi:hypothetical protein
MFEVKQGSYRSKYHKNPVLSLFDTAFGIKRTVALNTFRVRFNGRFFYK